MKAEKNSIQSPIGEDGKENIMKKSLGAVYETDDFSVFKTITGNRTEVEKRKRKIEKSVQEVGYIPAPIIVNEKMEIIDGQARFAYCKESGTPIAYHIIPNLTIDDCIAMNISATNWGMMDYIISYADRGLPSYVLTEKFILGSPYGLKPTLWALTRTDTSNIKEKIQTGALEITEEDYKNGMDIFGFWKNFDDIVTNRKAEFLIALGYCYLLPEVDNDRLIKKIHQRPRDFQMIASTTDAIDVIEDAYNVRAKTHVYIETEYFKYLENISKGLSSTIKAKRNRR